MEQPRVLVGHGSFTTIRQHYQRFQQELRDQPKAQWPSSVPARVVTGLETLWHPAMEAAETEDQTLKAETQQRVQVAALAYRFAQGGAKPAKPHPAKPPRRGVSAITQRD